MKILNSPSVYPVFGKTFTHEEQTAFTDKTEAVLSRVMDASATYINTSLDRGNIEPYRLGQSLNVYLTASQLLGYKLTPIKPPGFTNL